MELENSSITADGITGKVGEWIVFYRTKTKYRSTVVYKNSKETKWKVQVFNVDSEYWKEFNSLEAVRNFLNKIQNLYFYKGKFYTKGKFLKIKKCRSRKYSNDFINQVVEFCLQGHSAYQAGKKFNVFPPAIRYWLKRNGCKYLKRGCSLRFGKWVRN